MIKKTESRLLIKTFSKYFLPYITLEIILVILLIAGGIGSLATPYALKIIIDDIFPHGDFKELIILLSGLVVIYLFRIGASMASEIIQTKLSRNIVADIRQDMLLNLLNRPLEFYKHANSGEVLYTIMNDVQNIQSALSSLILLTLNDGITILGIIVMLGILNLKLTLISLLLLPIIIFSLKKFTPLLQSSFKNVQESEESLNVFFLEKLKNIRVVKSFNAINYEAKNLISIQKKLLSAYLKNARLSTLNGNIITFFVAIGPIIVLIYGGKDVFKSTMTVGALIAFIQYLNRLYSPTINIMNSYNQMARAVVSMERVIPYIEKTNLAPDHNLSTEHFSEKITTLNLNNVSLALGETKILENIQMEFEAGKIYGIVGPSGSGKTSIINLLCGFIQPTTGEILVNSKIAIQEIKNWASVLGLIEKENQLFSGSILDNLKYGTFSATEDEVTKAINQAKFREVLEGLLQGSATIINDTGTLLSDGQKQRISIVRAFLKNPSLIIFDEATASLDMQLELEIIKNLKIYFKDSIIIIITHRLSSVNTFDHVYNLGELMSTPN